MTKKLSCTRFALWSVLLTNFLLVIPPLFADPLFERGVEHFVNNRPREASLLLEQVVSEDPSNGEALGYLLYSYGQLGSFGRIVDVIDEIRNQGQRLDARSLFMGAWALEMQGRFIEAKNLYGQAIEVDPNYAHAYYKRAVLSLQTESFSAAIRDFELYKAYGPSPEVEPYADFALIDSIIAELSLAQAEEEERLQRLEAQRQEIERQRIAEEQRRQALLSSVLNSLNQETRQPGNIGAGTEEIRNDEEEFGRVN